MASKFTGLKYDDDCGFFAVHDGKIVRPNAGISGFRDDAMEALAELLYDEIQDGNDLYHAEPLYEGIMEAIRLSDWDTAESLYGEMREAMGLPQLAGTIDWRTVEPLDADEKCVDENPAYLSIAF